MHEIKVSVFKRKGKNRSPYYQMQYRDPDTDTKVGKSTGQLKKRDADRVAAKWEAELREGRDTKRSGRMPWSEFRRLYEDEVLASLADKTDVKVSGVFNVFERFITPKRLADMNEETLGRYQSHLRQQGRAESTIKGHLAHIKAALMWAKDRKLIHTVPSVKMPKRAKRGTDAMKGRPITLEEFERMLGKVQKVILSAGVRLPDGRKPVVVESWKHYLDGLWHSGLRLEESIDLHWTDRTRLCVEDLDCDRPMIWIPGDKEKGNRDRVLPMAPEFAEFLRETPQGRRHGFVFAPLSRQKRYGDDRMTANRVSCIVSDIGKAASVKVSETGGKVKFASAHDLRRSFGERWSSRVMPNILQELMRHENIQTTLRYYVGQNAKRTSAILWEAHRAQAVGGVLGGTETSEV